MIAASGRFDLPFTCTDSTGAPVAPTGTPTGTLVKNGTDLGTTVTVTMSTAQGIASCAIPSDAAVGDRFYIRVSAVISGTTYVLPGPAETVGVHQTGDSFARIGSAGAGLTALGDTRLAYLDSYISAINNLSSLCNLLGPPLLEIPDSGSSVYIFTVAVKDQEGKMVALDASPTIVATNASGTSRSGNLSSVTNQSTGRYTFTYTVASDATQESIRIVATGAVSGEARYAEWVGVVVDYAAYTMLAAIKAKTDNLPSSPAAVGSAMTLTSDYDAAKTAASQTSVNDLPTNAELATALDGISGGGSMTGAYAVSITVTDGSNPIPGALVRLKAGAVQGAVKADGSGVAAFSADDNTYSVRITAFGYEFTPVSLVVTGDASQSYAMTSVTVDETAWATGLDLVDYADASTIGQMLRDDGNKVASADVPDNPIVGRMLRLATGHINSALKVSKRYSFDQLAALDEAGLEHLRWLTCAIALWHLRQRRINSDPERQARDLKIIDDHLDRLRRGETVLGVEAQDAGIGEAVTFTSADVQRGSPLLRDRMSGTQGVFPNRRYNPRSGQ